jgi:hypothetical protein
MAAKKTSKRSTRSKARHPADEAQRERWRVEQRERRARKRAEQASAPGAEPFDPFAGSDAVPDAVSAPLAEPAPTLADSDTTLALDALRDVARDRGAPSAARAAASRALLEYHGALGKNATPPGAQDSRPLADLTRADMLARAAALRRQAHAQRGGRPDSPDSAGTA